MTNWKSMALKISEITLKYLENKELCKPIIKGDLHAIPIMKSKKMYKDYPLHTKHGNIDIFLFTYEDKLLLSFYDSNENKEIENSVHLNRIKLYYYICNKIFIDVKLLSTIYNTDNVSYHFILNYDSIKLRKLELDEDYLEKDELVSFSIRTILT